MHNIYYLGLSGERWLPFGLLVLQTSSPTFFLAGFLIVLGPLEISAEKSGARGLQKNVSRGLQKKCVQRFAEKCVQGDILRLSF